LFRIVQEALNNTVKHADATTVAIDLQQLEGSLQLTIADNGKGFAAVGTPRTGLHGMGMTTMRERAEAIGAQLHIHSELDGGTRITVDYALAPALTQLNSQGIT
jgi:signal transduction histidine kinase